MYIKDDVTQDPQVPRNCSKDCKNSKKNINLLFLTIVYFRGKLLQKSLQIPCNIVSSPAADMHNTTERLT